MDKRKVWHGNTFTKLIFATKQRNAKFAKIFYRQNKLVYDIIVYGIQLLFCVVVHAAVNAIINKTEESIEGCTLYTTLHPDDDCAHAIIQAGIKEVVYCMYTRNGSELNKEMKIADVLFRFNEIQIR